MGRRSTSELVQVVDSWLILWFVENARVIADTSGKLQTRCPSVVQSAAEHRVPLSASSLEMMHNGGRDEHITLEDGLSLIG